MKEHEDDLARIIVRYPWICSDLPVMGRVSLMVQTLENGKPLAEAKVRGVKVTIPKETESVWTYVGRK